jgi:hypothetical protein
MRVMRGRSRLSGLVAAVAVVGLAMGGCAAAPKSSILVIDVTLPSPTPTSLDTPTLAPTPAVGASATATDPGTGPTTPPPAVAVSYTRCNVVRANDPKFWFKSAKVVTWTVYCPDLPSSWTVLLGTYDGVGIGKLRMSWRGPDGAKIEIAEGAFCTTDAETCSPHETVIGPATLGDMLGSLDTLSGGGFAVYVGAGTGYAYELTGSGMSQDAFVSLAAAVVKVARP